MAKIKRQVPDFIQAYLDYLEPIPGPEQFKEWAALWTISAALERRVWTITQASPCYANLYIMLVGPSGCGKGITINTARNLIAALGSDRLGASSMTSAYFQQALAENDRSFVNPVTKEPEPYNALHINSVEMMVLFPVYDNDLFGNLTDLWDCGGLSVGRINKDRNSSIQRTCVTALFATTPVHIHDLITKNAWHGGFMSRTIMILGEAAKRQSAFIGNHMAKDSLALFQKMKETIKYISELQGEFTWTKEAQEAFDEFYQAEGNLGGPPVPNHPNLATYCIRRHQQIEKIMMCRAAGRNDEMILTIQDYEYAHNLLLNTEALMPDIYKGSHLGTPHDRADKVLFDLWQWQLSHKESIISGTRIFQEIHKKINYFSEAQHLYNLLINSDRIRKVPELQLTDRQRTKCKDWFKVLGGTFEEKGMTDYDEGG